MHVLLRAALARAAAATLAAALALAACGRVTAPPVPGAHPSGSSPVATPGPVAGSRAEAAALGELLLSRLILPPGAARLPQTPLPPSLSSAAYAGADVTPSLDQYQLYPGPAIPSSWSRRTRSGAGVPGSPSTASSSRL